MISNPVDVVALDVEAEWQKIHGALEPLVDQGLVQLIRLERATLATLQRQLRQGNYHIVHFVGHGGIDRRSGERVLYLEDERGRAHPVGGDHLGAILCDHRSLRLALLNACEGARADGSDPFAGVAQHLVYQGIPAIIAMQFEITDGAAITLTQEFYEALADGYPVEAALAEARKAIFVMGNDVEWGTPVLYSRASEGVLFRVYPAVSTNLFAEESSIGPSDENAVTVEETTYHGIGEELPDEYARTVLASNAKTSISRRSIVLTILLTSVLLWGGFKFGPQFITMLSRGVSGEPSESKLAIATKTAEQMLVDSSSSPTPTSTLSPIPTLTPSPNSEATAAIIAAVTATAVADKTAVAEKRATDRAATQATLPTATFTSTPQATDTPTSSVTSPPLPTDTATATSSNTLRPTNTVTPTPQPTINFAATRTVRAEKTAVRLLTLTAQVPPTSTATRSPTATFTPTPTPRPTDVSVLCFNNRLKAIPL